MPGRGTKRNRSRKSFKKNLDRFYLLSTFQEQHGYSGVVFSLWKLVMFLVNIASDTNYTTVRSQRRWYVTFLIKSEEGSNVLRVTYLGERNLIKIFKTSLNSTHCLGHEKFLIILNFNRILQNLQKLWSK